MQDRKARTPSGDRVWDHDHDREQDAPERANLLGDKTPLRGKPRGPRASAPDRPEVEQSGALRGLLRLDGRSCEPSYHPRHRRRHGRGRGRRVGQRLSGPHLLRGRPAGDERDAPQAPHGAVALRDHRRRAGAQPEVPGAPEATRLRLRAGRRLRRRKPLGRHGPDTRGEGTPTSAAQRRPSSGA